jgi:sec-independent protein translocase protein TatC
VNQVNDKSMSILQHLEALRRVLIISLIAIIPCTIAGWYVKQDILAILMKPVKNLGYKLVYLGATEALVTEFKIALYAGLVFALPVIAYQLWKFVLPALYDHERKYLLLIVPASVILFVAGVLFGYYLVFNLGIQFLLSFGGEGLSPMLSLARYVSFALWFLIPFGIVFEMPLIIILMARTGVIDAKSLAGKRKWVFLIAFIVSAVVTPTTDIFTQSVMALAIYFLYEISILLSYLVRPKQ